MRSAVVFIAVLLLASLASAQAAPAVSTTTTTMSPGGAALDEAGIRQAALDYIEGFYEANPERMERALHPDLAKRIVFVAPDGRARVENMSAMTLVQITRAKKPTPKDLQQKDLTILDVYGNAAVAKIVASDWIDYLQLGKVNGQWKIINVLWEKKPKSK